MNEINPVTVDLDIEFQGCAAPVVMPIESPLVQSLFKAVTYHWDVEPEFKRSGGTIPMVLIFQNDLGLQSLVLGFNVVDTGAHSPNEFMHTELFYKGIDTLICLLHNLGERYIFYHINWFDLDLFLAPGKKGI